MRPHGTRRALLATVLLAAALLPAFWLAGRHFARSVRAALGPELVARARQALRKEIQVRRLDYDRPGRVVIEGLRVARGESLERDGLLLTAARVELRYDPSLLRWSSLLQQLAGRNTRVRVLASDLRCRQPAPLPPAPLAAARSVAFSFDLRPLIFRSGDVEATIPRVDVDGLRARIARNRQGIWSFEPLLDLLRRRPERPTRFRGEIHATDALLEVLDARPGALPAPARNRVRGAAVVRYAAYPDVRAQAELQVEGRHGGAVSAVGFLNVRGGPWMVSATLDAGDLGYWQRYARPEISDFQLLGGAATARIAIWGERSRAPVSPAYRAELAVRDASARLRGFAGTIREFTGTVTATPAWVRLNGRAVAAGVPVRLSGEIAPGSVPQAIVRLASDAVLPERLLALAPRESVPAGLRVGGPAAVDAVLVGQGGTWAVTARARAPWVRFRTLEAADVRLTLRGTLERGGTRAAAGALEVALARVTPGPTGERPESGGAEETASAVPTARLAFSARDVRATFALRGKAAEFEARASLYDGAAEARGWVDLAADPPRFWATGTARELDLARVPLRGDRKLGGRVSGSFVASGPTDAPVVTAFAEGRDLAVDEEQVASAAGRLRYAGGTLEVRDGVVRDPRFTATVAGTLSERGALDLQLAARGVDLATALADRTKEPIGGQANCIARVTGTTEAPRVEGRVQVYRPRFRDYAGDYAEAGFVAEGPRRVRLEALQVLRAPIRVTAASLLLTRGDAPEAEWRVQGEARAEGLTLPSLLRLAGVSSEALRRQPLSGAIPEALLRVEGPAAAPRIAFEAAATDVALAGIDLGRLSLAGSLDAGAGTLEVDTLLLSSPTFRAVASGRLRFDPKAPEAQRAERTSLEFRFRAQGARLRPLLRRYAPAVFDYADVSGTLRGAEGRVSGTLARPEASARIELADLLVNRRVVPLEPLDVAWSREALLVRNVRATLGAGTIRAPYLAVLMGEETPSRRRLDRLAGKLEVRGVPVAALRQLFEDSPYYPTERARSIREALAQWRAPIVGHLDLSLDLPPGAEAAAPPESPDAAAALLRRRAPGARLEGSLEVPDLASPVGPEQPRVALAARFAYSGRRLEIRTLRLFEPERADGWEAALIGTLTAAEGEDPGAVDLRLAARGLRLRALSRLPLADLQERLEALQPLDGTLRLDAEASGSARRPALQFSLAVERPVVRGLPFDALIVERGSYAAERGVLRVAGGRLVRRRPEGPEAAVLFGGLLPLTWPDLTVPPDAARALSIEVPEQSLTVLNEIAAEADALAARESDEARARVQPLVETLRLLAATRGVLEGRVALGGTAAQPQNDGYLGIADAAFRLDALSTELRNVNARLEFSGNEIRVVRLAGESSQTGQVEIRGTIALGGPEAAGRQPPAGAGAPPGPRSSVRLDLTAAVQRLRFVETRIGRVIGESFRGTQVRATLQSVDRENPGRAAPIRIEGFWPRPRISGALLVDDAVLALAFRPIERRRPIRLPFDPELDVALISGPSVWIRQPGVTLKLDGRLHAGGNLSRPELRGEYRASRGSLSLPTLSIRNVEGTIRITPAAAPQELAMGPIAQVYLDLTGTATLRFRRSPAEEAEYYDATFEIRGSPGAEGPVAARPAGVTSGLAIGTEGGLTLTVRTDPPLPGPEIEALIRQQVGVEGFSGRGTNVVEALRAQIEQALAVSVTSAVTGPVERAVQSALGLDLFSIDVGIAQPLRVRLGKRLFDGVYAGATQAFAGELGYQRRLEIYYRVTPRFRVGIRREQPEGRDVFFVSGGFAF